MPNDKVNNYKFVIKTISVYPIKLLLIIGINFLSFLHPVHVSILNFDYSSKNKLAEISVKVFPDDFELAFNHTYNIKLNLGTEKIHPEWEKYLNLYFDKMFLLKTNNKTKIPLVFKNYKVEEDGVLLYFSAEMKGKIKSLQMDNSLLLDVFENQTNLVILNIDGKEKGYSLNYNSYKIDLNL